MTLSKVELAAQDDVVGDIIRSPEVVEVLERQLQTQPTPQIEQIQACQLEPGDRVLYKHRLMRVGSIQVSKTRRYGFFVSLLPADYDNPYSDYKCWQRHHQQHRLEVPSNWFTPWQRVQPEPTAVALPHNPFEAESGPITALETEIVQEGSLRTRHPIKVVQLSPTRFHCEDPDVEQGCVVWIEGEEFHAPTMVWPDLARRAIESVKSYLEENPLFLEYNRHQCCYCVYRNDGGGRYIGSTYGTSTPEALLQTDQMMQEIRAGVPETPGL